MTVITLILIQKFFTLLLFEDTAPRMRISVEIDEAVLRDAMALTGEKSRSPALARAVTGFVRRQKAREFGRLIRTGAFDYPSVVAESSPGEGSDPGNPVPPLFEE